MSCKATRNGVGGDRGIDGGLRKQWTLGVTMTPTLSIRMLPNTQLSERNCAKRETRSLPIARSKNKVDKESVCRGDEGDCRVELRERKVAWAEVPLQFSTASLTLTLSQTTRARHATCQFPEDLKESTPTLS